MEKEKINYKDIDWIDNFDQEFDYIRAVIDLGTGALVHDWSSPETVQTALNKILDRLDELNDLIQGVWKSIASSQKTFGDDAKKEEPDERPFSEISSTVTVVISKNDCCQCRFILMCSGAAIFQTIPTLQTMTFNEKSCPRNWESLKDLVEVSALPNQSPTP